MRGRFRTTCLAAMSVLLPALLPSCASVRSTAGGAAELAQLELVGSKAFSVKVSVDGEKSFSAKVNRAKDNVHKYQYVIPSGAHDITVLRGNEVLVSKKIYSTSGEVKVVVLP